MTASKKSNNNAGRCKQLPPGADGVPLQAAAEENGVADAEVGFRSVGNSVSSQ